jgi:aspartate aminotransferase
MNTTVATHDLLSAARVTSTRGRLSPVADSLKGSEILRIAGEIRAMTAAGERLCNLTVGDFDPKQFPIPKLLEEGITEALQNRETNYPPSSGLLPLREAVAAYYERTLGLRYPVESVLVTSGSRPGVYGTYRALAGGGDRVVYPAPSWNNNYYSDMVGAEGVAVQCSHETAFMPTAEALAPALRGASMLALNSPLNPCGTMFTPDSLGAICDLVLEENARRAGRERPLFLLYDQVYWQLTFGTVDHVDPVSLRPEIAPYTVYIDGISKAFAATGVRVGWVIGPTDVIAAMNNFLGHVGTWAPRAEQLATARLLTSPDHIATYRSEIARGIQARLDALYRGIMALNANGHPLTAIEPMGAIYLSAKFDLAGRTTSDGKALHTDDDVREWLLLEAGLAVVPFRAFGATADSGWHRLSVGAVSLPDIEWGLGRLGAALEKLS